MTDSPSSPPPADGAARFSVERLSSAFARLMGAPAGDTPMADAPLPAADAIVLDDADAPPSPHMIVEGMLFVGRADGRPLTAREMAEPIRDVDPVEVQQIIDRLNDDYAAAAAPWEVATERGGYCLRLRDGFEPVRQRLRGDGRAMRLSPAAIEVLALVAYRQPVSAEAISKARGVRSHPVLAGLVRRDLVAAQRRAEGGKTPETTYHTTDRFNRVFGVDSPADLPQSDHLDDG